MKTILQNVRTTTQDFNLFGKVLTYSILAMIAICAVALIIGVATTNNIQFKY